MRPIPLLVLGLLGLMPAAATLRAQLRGDTDTQALSLPAVGSCTLRILTPRLLELEQVSASASGPAAAPAFEVAVDGRAVGIAAERIKRRVAYAPLARRDLRIATFYYMEMAEPLSPGPPAPRVRVRAADNPALDAVATFDPLRESPAIHVNQEGYAPALPKKAMVGYYLGDGGELKVPAAAGFTLVDARSGKPVFTGSLVPRPDVGFRSHPLPYQRVYEADFSAFTAPGEYRLLVPGLGTSLPFLVDDGVAMGFARTYALGLYEQRCGASNALPFTRFVHGACHDAPAQVPTSDPPFAFTWSTIARYAAEANADNPPQAAPVLAGAARQLYPFVNAGPVDVSGGHHDAGDYSKYTINSAQLVHVLVFAVDSIPGVAALDNLGIPESGDGIPDVLEEAKWEADYLAKLQDADGGFYFLVYPKNREYESNVEPDHGDPQVVWPKNTAATAAAVAALAQCASSPQFRRHFPDAAARYLAQAQRGWQFLTKAIADHGKAGAYQKITFYGDRFTHDDELAWAACELFLATGDSRFQAKLLEWFPNPADPATFRWGWWRMDESWGNAIRSYAFAARSGRLPAAALDARYLDLCEREVLAAGDDALRWSDDNAYATPFPPATKAVNGGGWYFSLDQASDIAVAYAIDPKPAYLSAMVGAMNYEGGCNPVNVAYLTGLGVHRQREIVDQYAQNDGRLLPPSGIPLGNIQASFQYMPAYGPALHEASYPADDAPQGPYPLYDRWSDAYNVTTEFITVNQARGLLVTALLAGRTGAAGRPWKGARAAIAREGPALVRASVPGEDLAHARITWESRRGEPAFGPTYTLSARADGPTWVEAEVEWPDGRRAFGAETFTVNAPDFAWIHGSVPEGGETHASGGDAWTWVNADPAPRFGGPEHQSNVFLGLHEHWFTGASDTLAVGTGDSLYAWVYLDPANPPSEVLLSWNDGASGEHRAYWGANTITYGRNDSAGRFHAGDLPPAGRWVRLRVAARDVGLEGVSVSGMGFSLVDGRATWGDAGRYR